MAKIDAWRSVRYRRSKAGLDAFTARLSGEVPLPIVLLAMIFALPVAVPFVRVIDPDFWWHLETGEIIFRAGVPQHDVFSWTAAGRPWVTHEWLSELLIYAVQATAGYWANALLFTATALSALALAYTLGRSLGASNVVLGCLTLASTLALTGFLTVRPQVFSWLLFSVFLFVLTRASQHRSTSAWILPVLMLLWTNLHLGFFFGLMLLGCWGLATGWEAWKRRDVEVLREPLLITSACIIATSMNPAGPGILWYPTRYMFDGEVTRSMVAEWHRPMITAWFEAPAYVASLLLGVALLSRHRPQPFLMLASVAVIVLSMQAVRNIPFALIVAVPVVGATASRHFSHIHFMRDSAARLPLPIAASLVGLVLILSGAIALPRAQGHLSLRSPSEDRYPAVAAALIEEQFSGARLLNDYNYGGYLIYKLHPAVPLFIDGRTDFYGNDLLSDYQTMQEAEDGWRGLIDAYGVEVVLMQRHRPIAAQLANDSDWSEVFRDERDVMFARAE